MNYYYLFFNWSIYTQKPIFCKFIKKLNGSHLHKYSDPLLSTLFNKHLWQRLQPRVFWGMTLQAWHTCIWRVSPILLCRSSQALSGWVGSVAAQVFSGLFRDVRWDSSPGSGWATQGHWDLTRNHSCVVLAVCLGLLSCWKVKLWSRFSSSISLLCSVHLSLGPD